MLSNHYVLQVVILLAVAARVISTEMLYARHEAAVTIASQTATEILNMFLACASTSMPTQFLADDLKSFVNFPSRTTVGFAPKYTSNRKFFANMIGTIHFREMLQKDEDEMRVNLIKKLKYCDESIMDQNILKEFYDREVDQSKI